MTAVAQKRGPQLQGLYLGLLYPTEEHGVYGYITNTKIKLVVVTAGDMEPSDNAVKQFLHQFHKLPSLCPRRHPLLNCKPSPPNTRLAARFKGCPQR